VNRDEGIAEELRPMSHTITTTLSADIEPALAEISRMEGMSRDEVVGRAVKQHLFLRRFRSLRERMLAKATDQGIVTEQDVIGRVS
jgi:hypothetical protein